MLRHRLPRRPHRLHLRAQRPHLGHQRVNGLSALAQVLFDTLGALGDPSVMGELREMLSHPVDILRESCVVALHMYDREAFLAAGVCV